MINHDEIVLLILIVVVAYCLISKRLTETIITLPIIFTALGYLVHYFLKDIADAETLNRSARILAEVTLVLVLFADASHVRFHKLSESYQLPLRMLVLGMPMTIAAGTCLIYLLSPESGWAIALLTAAILTPTDAALGQSVVSSIKVPQRLSQAINVESGLNDGLALPFVLIGAILAGSAGMMAHGQEDQNSIAKFAILQVTLGPLIGICIGWLAARALDWAQNRDWINLTSQGVFFWPRLSPLFSYQS
jgi:NhaP-type Na+/H+ or K+/H+ antiporter